MSCAKSVLPAYMAVSTGKPARLPCHSVQVDTPHLPPQTQSISRSPRHDPSVNRTAVRGIEFCLRGDLEAEEIESSGLDWGRPRQDGRGTCVAEADAVAGEVGEVAEEGAEAVDGLAVFGSPGDGLAARRGRDFSLGDRG